MRISHINETITDPEKARSWVKDFMKSLGKDFETGFVNTNEQRTIHFNDMSDEDAVFVANQLQGWTAEAAKNRANKRNT